MHDIVFPVDELASMAIDLRISPAQAVYLAAAMRFVADACQFTAAQAIHAVRTNKELGDYLRERLQLCVASALSEGAAR